MNKKTKTNHRRRRQFGSATRTLSWPNLRNDATAPGRFHETTPSQLSLQPQPNTVMGLPRFPDAVTNAPPGRDGNGAVDHQSRRCSLLFESSNPILPDIGSFKTIRMNGYGASRQPPRQRSSSPSSSTSQRFLRLADLLQEALDLSSTCRFPENDLGDDDMDSDNRQLQ